MGSGWDNVGGSVERPVRPGADPALHLPGPGHGVRAQVAVEQVPHHPHRART